VVVSLAVGWHGIGQLPAGAALGAVVASALALGLAACWMAGRAGKERWWGHLGRHPRRRV